MFDRLAAGEIELGTATPGHVQDLLLILEYEVAMPLRSGQSMSRMAVLGMGSFRLPDSCRFGLRFGAQWVYAYSVWLSW